MVLLKCFFREMTLSRQIPPPFPQRTTKNDGMEGKLAPLISPTTRLSKGDFSSSPCWDLLRGKPLGGVPFPKINSGWRLVRCTPSWGSCPTREMNTRDFANASLWPRGSIFNKKKYLLCQLLKVDAGRSLSRALRLGVYCWCYLSSSINILAYLHPMYNYNCIS